MYYYGPISYPKIIRSIYTNIYNDPALQSGYIARINVANANGVFKVDDMVYQGNTYQTATAYGSVVKYNPDLNQMVIGAVQGSFKVNTAIHALSTNGACVLDSFYVSPMKLAEIVITPEPVNAEPTDDYGYNINITEWPETEN
jgi:hypothetical protein